jgi:crotonobetainyl-CoA:carnitine CoA-transferase CaiB-like acyl-CoA transferase
MHEIGVRAARGEGLRLRHDRPSRRRPGQHHRLARPAAGQARVVLWSQCRTLVHYMRTWLAIQARTRRSARRRGDKSRRQQFALRPLSLQTLRAQRLRPHHHQPRQPRGVGRSPKLLGREDLIGDERYATMDARIERSAKVDESISQWTGDTPRTETLRCRRSRCGSTAPIASADLANPWLAQRAGSRRPAGHRRGGSRGATPRRHYLKRASAPRPSPWPGLRLTFSMEDRCAFGSMRTTALSSIPLN